MGTTNTPFFIPGDLVISVYGDGADTGNYGDNQAAPIVLEQVTTAGVYVSQLELPQTTTIVNGVTEYAVSGEYGSSSEGTLELSEDGQSLVIMGYGVNAATFLAGGVAQYGTLALAQSNSIPNNGSVTPVARVVADINAYGTVDSSTAVYNFATGNNPRSVATVNGSTFYISGQGISGDTTQGVFEVQDGTTTSSPTIIDDSTDTRTVEIYNNELYVSRDSKQPKSTGTSNISNYGSVLPTSATSPIILNGISQSITLTAAEENGVNNSRLGKSVDLSPENFFFASPTVLYVADSGNPKEGTLGDGGLQKWMLVGKTWTLEYTISAGLNLVANTASAGTTGLIGLTGTVVGNQVYLYATNATINDLDQTYLFGVSDVLNATTAAAGESFTTLVTAAADTNIRGVAFAPSVSCFTPGTLLRAPNGAALAEDVRPGDLLLTQDGRAAPVRWVGRRRIEADRHSDPALVWPVRVRAHAFAPGMPARDLVLSPDHCVRIDDLLVPIRLLANGATIAQEPVRLVDYLHIELDRHDILLAEGLAVESYLDEGTRGQFEGALTLHPDFSTRAPAAAACLPVVLDAATVAPIWQRLAVRAAVLGHAAAAADTTADPALLLRAGGRTLVPVAREGDRLLFALPADARQITFVSRADRPAATCPWLDDRRLLGVQVRRIAVTDAAGAVLDLPLDGPALIDGWHAPEAASGLRWTDGTGTVALPPGARQLAVRLAGEGMRYRLPAAPASDLLMQAGD
jgi:hypothetical protein